MTSDFADQFDRTLVALQDFLMSRGAGNAIPVREAQEAYRQIAYLRDQLGVEPIGGSSSRPLFHSLKAFFGRR